MVVIEWLSHSNHELYYYLVSCWFWKNRVWYWQRSLGNLNQNVLRPRHGPRRFLPYCPGHTGRRDRWGWRSLVAWSTHGELATGFSFERRFDQAACHNFQAHRGQRVPTRGKAVRVEGYWMIPLLREGPSSASALERHAADQPRRSRWCDQRRNAPSAAGQPRCRFSRVVTVLHFMSQQGTSRPAKSTFAMVCLHARICIIAIKNDLIIMNIHGVLVIVGLWTGMARS